MIIWTGDDACVYILPKGKARMRAVLYTGGTRAYSALSEISPRADSDVQAALKPSAHWKWFFLKLRLLKYSPIYFVTLKK